jgi:NAD+ synthase
VNSRAQDAFLGFEALRLDAAAAVEHISAVLRAQITKQLRRRGLVVGLSGGVDSSVVAALAVRALGARNVFAVLMPEQDGETDSLRLGRQVAEELGIASVVEDITPILAAAGCYRRRDEHIRRVFPAYGAGWKSKIVVRKAQGGSGYNLSYLVIQSSSGEVQEARMPVDVYLGIVSATNMKQRTRKQIEYYHADRLNFAVAGTPNKLEYDQGFFVKNGDGAADVKPIAHLYKSQVYQLAEYLGVPEEIQRRTPTTDTYSLAQTQEEFYFGISLEKLDYCMFALDHGVPAADTATVLGLSAEQVDEVYRDIQGKRRATRYLHEPPLLIQPL